MEQKRAVIDELLTEDRIYLDEHVEITVETIHESDVIPEHCPKCKGIMKEIYKRSLELLERMSDYDLIVFRCGGCGVYYAFYVEPPPYDIWLLTPSKKDEHLGGRIVEPTHWKHVGKPEWGEGKRPRFPEKAIKAYKKTGLQLSNLTNKLDVLVQSKLGEMYKAGLGIETINSARYKALDYMRKNSVTSKQLVALFAAAIYEASHEELKMVGGLKRIGERISECHLENIFGITRKTIRKWRKRILRRATDFYL